MTIRALAIGTGLFCLTAWTASGCHKERVRHRPPRPPRPPIQAVQPGPPPGPVAPVAPVVPLAQRGRQMRKALNVVRQGIQTNQVAAVRSQSRHLADVAAAIQTYRRPPKQGPANFGMLATQLAGQTNRLAAQAANVGPPRLGQLRPLVAAIDQTCAQCHARFR